MKLINLFISFFSIIVLGVFTWFRFFTERVPRDIPFNLTELRFLSLLMIILLYTSSIINLIRKPLHKPGSLISVIKEGVNNIYNYISSLFEKLAHMSYYIPFIMFLNKLHVQSFQYIFFFIDLLPRYLMCIIFILDTFSFHFINNYYKIVLIGFIFFLNKLILSFIKFNMDVVKRGLDEQAELHCYDIIDREAYNIVPILTTDEFIKEELNRILNGQKGIDYLPSWRIDFLQAERKRRNLPDKHRFNLKHWKLRVQENVNFVVYSTKILLFYNQAGVYYKKDLLFLNITYVVSWSYILLISIIPIEESLYNSILNIVEKIEPFSGTFL